MVSDGRYAKDAIRKLLANARAREATASKIFEFARDNLDEARDEVRAAEAMMEEAEGKWHEIVIDDEDTSSTAASSLPLKRRLTFPASSYARDIAVDAATATAVRSTSSTSSSESDDEGSTVVPSKKRKNIVATSSTGGIAVAAAITGDIFAPRHDAGDTSGAVGVLASNAAANIATSNGDDGGILVVKGCAQGVNGTFKRRDGFSNTYEKIGSWEGRSGTFIIFRTIRGGGCLWTIGFVDETSWIGLYAQYAALETPPSDNGWIRDEGCRPPPNTCQMDATAAEANTTAGSRPPTLSDLPLLHLPRRFLVPPAVPQATHQVTLTSGTLSNGVDNGFFKVVVRGCKYGVVNGTYRRSNGSKVYMKGGVWKGDRVTFEMDWKEGVDSGWNVYMNHGGTKRWMACDRSLVLDFF